MFAGERLPHNANMLPMDLEGSNFLNAVVALSYSNDSETGNSQNPPKEAFLSRLSGVKDSIVDWFIKPEDPKKISIPIEEHEMLSSLLSKAASAQRGHEGHAQESIENEARVLFEESALSQVMTLTPGISGLHLEPKRRFRDRVSEEFFNERGEVVYYIAPKLLQK